MLFSSLLFVFRFLCWADYSGAACPWGFLLLPWTVLAAAPHPYRKYKACFGMGEERCTLAFCHLIYLLNAFRTTGYPSIAISFF